MSQLTIDDLLHYLISVKGIYGGDVPLWLAYPTSGPCTPLPALPTETVMRPLVDARLDESVPGSPAVLLLGLGTTLGEPSLTLDLDPEVLTQGGLAHGE